MQATSGSQPPYVSMQYIEDSVFVGWSDNRGNEETNEYQIWDDEYGSYSSRGKILLLVEFLFRISVGVS